MKPQSMVVALLLVSLAACSAPESEIQTVKKLHPAMDVQTLTLQASDVPVYYITSGVVSSDHRVAISSRISGYIRALLVREGDRIKKGQILVRVDPVNARQSLAQARADLADAKSDLDRYRKLLAEQAVSKQQLDKVQLRFKVARSRVAQAENQLRYAEITSPVNGIVIHKAMSTGDMAKPGTPILTVEDPSQLLVETDVSGEAVSALQPGNVVDISIPALHQMRTGHIRQLVNAADPLSHQFHVKISLDSTNSLRAGMFAEVKFRMGVRQAILIPADAVIHRSGLNGIYVVDKRGVIHYRQIRLGPKYADRIEVVAGLYAGDRIAWSAEHSLRTNMTIQNTNTPIHE
ncbi:MAG: efflux RND transporter periplasmic adaptor subunit [Zetaproteobacteria bacterium]|nr:MAG: efflux RND transporter periplasmic adaptor subunit [Zetaproteobacteria bacterium]